MKIRKNITARKHAVDRLTVQVRHRRFRAVAGAMAMRTAGRATASGQRTPNAPHDQDSHAARADALRRRGERVRDGG